jgi:hypothetical protein
MKNTIKLFLRKDAESLVGKEITVSPANHGPCPGWVFQGTLSLGRKALASLSPTCLCPDPPPVAELWIE